MVQIDEESGKFATLILLPTWKFSQSIITIYTFNMFVGFIMPYNIIFFSYYKCKFALKFGCPGSLKVCVNDGI